MTTGSIALAARDLRKSYGDVRAVDGLSLDVRRGDLYGLVGRNGAGKSTTLRLLLGLVRPDAGSFQFGDETTANVLPRHRRRLGALVEAPGFFPELTAEENVRLLGGLSAPVCRNDALRLLGATGLAAVAGRRASGFSLGMKQRLGLACALAGDPDVVVLDEPTNGLDPEGVKDLRETLLSLRAERGLTFVVSSHMLAEIERVATRLGVVRDGRLAAEGTPAELLAATRRVVVAATPQAAARRALEAFGTTRVDGPRIVVAPKEGVARADMVRALVEAGVDVESFAPDERALEALVLGEEPAV